VQPRESFLAGKPRSDRDIGRGAGGQGDISLDVDAAIGMSDHVKAKA